MIAANRHRYILELCFVLGQFTLGTHAVQSGRGVSKIEIDDFDAAADTIASRAANQLAGSNADEVPLCSGCDCVAGQCDCAGCEGATAGGAR